MYLCKCSGIVDLIVCAISAKLTSKNKKLPKGNICLVHQYAEISSLRNDNDFKSRYFPFLKEYLYKKKIDSYYK